MLSEQVNTAEKLVDPLTDQLFFAFDENFHEGIVGLVASRLMNHYYRPALVMRRGESETTGSARSVEGFHITQALEYCADLLVRFGGARPSRRIYAGKRQYRGLSPTTISLCRRTLDRRNAPAAHSG